MALREAAERAAQRRAAKLLASQENVALDVADDENARNPWDTRPTFRAALRTLRSDTRRRNEPEELAV